MCFTLYRHHRLTLMPYFFRILFKRQIIVNQDTNLNQFLRAVYETLPGMRPIRS